MRKYKLDGKFVDADAFIDFLKVGVKQLQAENEVLNEENKELKAILSFKNDVADSMHQYKMKYEDAIFEIDRLKEEISYINEVINFYQNIIDQYFQLVKYNMNKEREKNEDN